MALGQLTQEKRVYLSINHGKVLVQGTNGAKAYSFVEGSLEAIYKKSATFGGEEVVRWYINLRDGADLYTVCLPYSSGVFRSIILSLASVEQFTPLHRIRIEPYEGRNGFTRVSVYVNGEKLDWIKRPLPAQEIVTVGGKQVKDDSKQMAVIASLVEEIQRKLKNYLQIAK